LKTSLTKALAKKQLETGEEWNIAKIAREYPDLSYDFLRRFQNGEIQLLNLERAQRLVDILDCDVGDILIPDSAPESP